MLNLIKSDIVNKKNTKLIEKKSVKQFPSSVREWNNSIYVYNKNALNLIPYTTSLANNLIKSFFNLYNSKVERKMRTKRLLLRLRRLSLNKIFVSKGEFKHTNNKVTITLYVFNRQKRSYINRMKKLSLLFFFIEKNNIATKLIRESKLKILHYLKKAGKSEEFILSLINKNNSKNTAVNLNNHIRDFYKKYAKKSYIYIKTFFFYKQLLYLNRTKYSYTYLKYLKICLEKLYNKNVELNLINIKRFYLNSDIMSESLTIKLTKNRRKILAYLKDIRKKVKINKKKKFLLEPVRERIFNKNLIENTNLSSNNVTKKDIVFSELKYKDVTGFRLEAKGRLTKRFTASRSLTKFKYKGNLLNIDSSHRGLSTILLKGNMRSNLQYTKLQSKTRIGSFGIKGWVSGN
jgi:ribosomal VAR1-like protein